MCFHLFYEQLQVALLNTLRSPSNPSKFKAHPLSLFCAHLGMYMSLYRLPTLARPRTRSNVCALGGRTE